SAGTCTGGSPVTCAPAASCHEASTCTPGTGVCETGASLPDGTSCHDGNACTTVDSCWAGTCTGGSPVTCAPAASCHEASTCNPGTGVCETGASQPDGTSCNDGNACTTVDSCSAGTCTGGSPVICAPADSCHEASTCNQATGVCDSQPKPDGTVCSDGNACTMGDACVQGSCIAGPPTDLDGDGRIDAACAGTDCNDANPFVWAAPVEVTELAFSSGSTFSWTDQASLTGPETAFDLASGSFSTGQGFGFSQSACLQAGGGVGYSDNRQDPSLGQGYWYLVRARNSCGTGTYGSQPRDASILSCDSFSAFNVSAGSEVATLSFEGILLDSGRILGANP
ncbi:MAG TPA: hypothetical protein VFW45_05215, partial [Candidatus Polarisedimenticolia bacterium]|nr:hypothetical protein [Candidatus Polarisedimenticolia bacterium]